MNVPESIVLCEGFDDRAFWQGLLLHHFGCKDARSATSVHKFQGVYMYETPNGGLLHVVPCGEQNALRRETDRARNPVLAMGRILLKARATKPLFRLVLNPDVDMRSPADTLASIRTLAGDEATEGPLGEFELDGGQSVVSPILWNVPDPVAPGIPSQQALERIVSAALCRAFPARGVAVGAWLATRPEPRGKEHKAHAWSFMAGWHTDHGMGDFYSSLWRDADVSKALRAILEQTGAWATITRLVGLPSLRRTGFEAVVEDDEI